MQPLSASSVALLPSPLTSAPSRPPARPPTFSLVPCNPRAFGHYESCQTIDIPVLPSAAKHAPRCREGLGIRTVCTAVLRYHSLQYRCSGVPCLSWNRECGSSCLAWSEQSTNPRWATSSRTGQDQQSIHWRGANDEIGAWVLLVWCPPLGSRPSSVPCIARGILQVLARL